MGRRNRSTSRPAHTHTTDLESQQFVLFRHQCCTFDSLLIHMYRYITLKIGLPKGKWANIFFFYFLLRCCQTGKELADLLGCSPLICLEHEFSVSLQFHLPANLNRIGLLSDPTASLLTSSLWAFVLICTKTYIIYPRLYMGTHDLFYHFLSFFFWSTSFCI